MAAKLLEGKSVAAAVRAEIAAQVRELRAQGHRAPGLVALLAGENPASQSYVLSKKRAAEECGFAARVCALPANVSRAEYLAAVDALNADPEVDGFICQLPLPKGLDEDEAIERIDPAKDVDGLHPENMGRLLLGWEGGFVPCTPLGCRELLVRHGVELEGKRVVIVGRSRIVGKPLMALLASAAAQGGQPGCVQVCHSRTRDLRGECLRAEILVAAVGKPGVITADMVQPGAVVVDVGINRVADPASPKGSRIVGDVDFEAIREKAGAITPVPGGVGLMTVCMLLRNTMIAWRRGLARRGELAETGSIAERS